MKEKASLSKDKLSITKSKPKLPQGKSNVQDGNHKISSDAIPVNDLEDLESGDLKVNMSYIGSRIRWIRKNSLGKTQGELVDDLNLYYKQDNLFNQPRLYQIEMLSSQGVKTSLLLNYLITLGFNANWILAIDNKEIPERNSNEIHLDASNKTNLLKGASAIKKQSLALQTYLDEFNKQIEYNLNNM